MDMSDGKQLSEKLLELSEEQERGREDKAEQVAWLAQQYGNSMRETILQIGRSLYSSCERNQYIAQSYDRLSSTPLSWQAGQVSLIVHQLGRKKTRLLNFLSFVHHSALRDCVSP